MKPLSFDTFLTPSKLAIHKDSHTINKLKPKIRIIHIVAPEIIKTDAENFRELVQRLTGKPTAEVKDTTKEKREVKGSTKKESNVQSKSLHSCCSQPKKNMESAEGIINESEGEIYGDFPDGFLKFLEDVDDFFDNEEESKISYTSV
ncbi:VQ motif-containing protein 25-like [Olea europaea var. sylvestris]|uniref:VQ domain-containing protein n=1 Tax=Olea europaea subsp. europaea TaxID=158383 RepID=A0A8S0QKG5_OLEEU|nr:VQ motif-containing protein 25-like [Olea europaea var. sylvestris]CAA2966714.1 Hypothetical predicted protein [Olea europaea subsp. europaea]